MAYQTRQRDPLLDSNMQQALERRGKELLGIVLTIAGLMALALVWSYSPEDPSWISATDAPVQNWMGRMGAAIAAPVMMVVGWGGLGIGAVLAAWGLRFTLHQGEGRILGRIIFAPIAVALLALYSATLVPAESWTHSFGLGGIFGDTALGLLLTVVPLGAAVGVKLLSALIALALVLLGAFVLGFTWREVKLGAKFSLIGVVMAYSMLLNALGRGAKGGVRATAKAHDAWAERKARREEPLVEDDEPEPSRVRRAELVAERAPAAQAESSDGVGSMLRRRMEQGGLFARVLGRAEPLPEDELVEPEPVAEDQPPADEDRIRGKIKDVLKSRGRPPLTATADPESAASAAAARRGQGRKPLLIGQTRDGLPAEPPVTGSQAGDWPQEPPMTRRAVPEPETYADDVQADDTWAGDVPGDEEPMIEEPMIEEAPARTAKVNREPMRDAAVPERPAPEAERRVQPQKKAPQPSRRAREEAQPNLAFEEGGSDYENPPFNLLTNPDDIERLHLSDDALEENARMLENVLDDYGVKGEIVSVRPGPVVTMYELEPAPGLKASRVIGLADDIARSMAALSARVSTVPGRSVIGIELPNANREQVILREILSSREYDDTSKKLPLALGKDIGGDPIVANLAKMPHLLIAGTTGSGKSVAINTMILSLLYRLTPDECRLIMIDPKMLELSVYDGIPHLLSPVVTDPKKAVVALKWVVAEMEERYRKMSKMGVRNIEGYNARVRDAQSKGEMFSRTVQTGFDDETGDPIFETEEFAPEAMPYIVVIVDEMADLMMVAGKEIEACIQRLAQMARASGIHLIMATQRPSVDVITGTIKANFPTRISFQVTSKVDSRTILGEQGAEQLLGMGDMLYMAGGARITRCHGPFVSDEEVEDIVRHLKQFGPPDYQSGVVEGPEDEKSSDIDAVLGLSTGGNTGGEDALYDQAVQIVIKDRKCSTSYIQRKLAIGYNKAARLVEQMEDEGVVSASNHVGKREVLVPEQA